MWGELERATLGVGPTAAQTKVLGANLQISGMIVGCAVCARTRNALVCGAQILAACILERAYTYVTCATTFRVILIFIVSRG